MESRATFDIYGCFLVDAEQTPTGVWLFYLRGAEGKRSRVFDVVVDDGAPLDEIERQLEAIHHELGRPNTSIRQVRR